MTEQLEDAFWAQARAEAAAARGKQADPTACGTCRKAVAAGAQVEHDECAQRATLLPAPDAPGYELITGMSEAEVAALPPRFHVPAFIESSTPKSWVCAVCWGDGWSSQWPCATAVQHGTQVFTPEHTAETAAKKQAARIAELEAELAKHGGQETAVTDTGGYPPALPWAAHMDADDLEGFLAELEEVASGDDDLTTLAAVENTIATWRAIAEAQHAHNTAPGPNVADGEDQ